MNYYTISWTQTVKLYQPFIVFLRYINILKKKNGFSKVFLVVSLLLLINNTFIISAWKLAKNQAKANNLRLNFSYLEIIIFLHRSYHLRIIGHILKIVRRTSTPVHMRLYDSWQRKQIRKWKIDHIDTIQIDQDLEMETIILNIKYVSL